MWHCRSCDLLAQTKSTKMWPPEKKQSKKLPDAGGTKNPGWFVHHESILSVRVGGDCGLRNWLSLRSSTLMGGEFVSYGISRGKCTPNMFDIYGLSPSKNCNLSVPTQKPSEIKS